MLERLTLSKGSITRLLEAAIALLIAGCVGGTVVVIVALANGAVAVGGSQPLSIDPGPFTGAIVGLVVASLLIAAGSVAAVVAWAAALLNTARLEDKAWFTGLLGLGLVSLGWLALIAYALKGPDSTAVNTTRPAGAAATTPLTGRDDASR